MKAVLITEMPKHCFECYFRGGEDQYSVCCTPDLSGKEVGEYDECKPDWCPLRPMPERVYYGKDCSEWDDGYQSGVAATLRAIEGGEKDG